MKLKNFWKVETNIYLTGIEICPLAKEHSLLYIFLAKKKEIFISFLSLKVLIFCDLLLDWTTTSNPTLPYFTDSKWKQSFQDKRCKFFSSNPIWTFFLLFLWSILLFHQPILQWAPLNGITVKGIIWLMGSNWPRLIKSQLSLILCVLLSFS